MTNTLLVHAIAVFLIVASSVGAQESPTSGSRDSGPTREQAERAASLRAVLATLADEVETSQAELDAALSRLAEVRTEVSAAEGRLEELGRNQARVEADLREGEAERDELEAETSSMGDEVSGAEASLTELASRRDSLRDEVAGVETTLTGLASRRDSLEAEVSRIENRIAGLERQRSALDADVAERRATLDALEVLEREARTRLSNDQARAQLARAGAEAAEMAATRTQSLLAGREMAARARLENLRGAVRAADAALRARRSEMADLAERGPIVAEPVAGAAIEDDDADRSPDRDASSPEAPARVAERFTAGSVPPAAGAPVASRAVEAADPIVEPDVAASAQADFEAAAPEAAGAGLDGREATEVRAALARAPGLADVPAPRLIALERLLIEGECPMQALDDAIGRLNRQTIASLVRDLGSC